uniref:Odorant receptor n=1 Tax=Adelphocoris lineolatus TaxID=236346 RepID=A0A2I4PH59_ADELI|nr:olfactory receptor 47 [Adelphocoris lineolatus]
MVVEKKTTTDFEREVRQTVGEITAEDVFPVQLRVLQIVAMWPAFNGSPQKQMLTKVILNFNSFVLAFCTVGLLLKGIITRDLVDRSEAMDIFTLTGSALYKMVFFYIYHNEMADMMNCGAALIHQVPPKWMQYVTFFTVLHCFMGFICITFWALCPILKLIFGETELNEMTLPINLYDPMEAKGAMFALFYFICHYGLISSAHIYMAADCYLFTAIHLANGGFQTLNGKLEDMKQAIAHKGDTSHDSANEYIKDCIKLHVHILTFIRKTDALFRSLFVADVVHAIISLSFAMLQASESKGIFENLKMTVFVSYCFVHQYLNSYFGQHLIDQQDTLFEKLLLSVPWNDCSRNLRKSYHIMTTGCLKSVRLSAWSVYTLQFATFLEFVKTMISYFMVLRQVQDETEVQIEI